MVKRKNKRKQYKKVIRAALKKKLRRKSKVKFKNSIQYKKVTLDNQSRKGEYIYIYQHKKGGRYFKVFPNVTKQEYIRAYKRGIKIKKRGLSKKKRKVQKKSIEKLTRQFPKVEDLLGKGVARYTIREGKNLNPQNIRKAYTSLLLNEGLAGMKVPVIKNPNHLKVLTRPETIQKWNNRVMFLITLYNQNGDTLGLISNMDKKTLPQVKREVIDKINLGEDYNAQYDKMKLINKSYRISAGQTRAGKVNKIEIRLTYRKAN